jgi:hypothetical protein
MKELKAEAYDLIIEQAKIKEEFNKKTQKIANRLNEIAEKLKELESKE